MGRVWRMASPNNRPCSRTSGLVTGLDVTPTGDATPAAEPAAAAAFAFPDFLRRLFLPVFIDGSVIRFRASSGAAAGFFQLGP